MKDFIKWVISIISIFLFLVSCKSAKINTKEEKVGVLGNDYTIEKYKIKNDYFFGGYITLKVFNALDKNDIFEEKAFHYILNDVLFFQDINKESHQVTHRVLTDRKHYISVGSVGFKDVTINHLYLNKSDSIVVNVYLNEQVEMLLE